MISRLWVDDSREDPDTKWTGIAEPQGWLWAKNSQNAIAFLIGSRVRTEPLEEISLDHDLGGEDTGMKVLNYMIAHHIWPKVLTIHTANPVARGNMLRAAHAEAPSWVDIYWVIR